jgi:hypothetical protein
MVPDTARIDALQPAECRIHRGQRSSCGAPTEWRSGTARSDERLRRAGGHPFKDPPLKKCARHTVSPANQDGSPPDSRSHWRCPNCDTYHPRHQRPAGRGLWRRRSCPSGPASPGRAALRRAEQLRYRHAKAPCETHEGGYREVGPAALELLEIPTRNPEAFSALLLGPSSFSANLRQATSNVAKNLFGPLREHRLDGPPAARLETRPDEFAFSASQVRPSIDELEPQEGATSISIGPLECPRSPRR